ncbi:MULTISPECIES: bifunctional DNA-formamidopyrimidine glycosylase/DNA-(apurinic or apyrimidinic site) lyase [Legionella]|uniref:Formamidopyrimidine-DNA glycosylase n=1 Tax=Legionella resiliens TaxID=2905958 RepID=A0ABS8X0T2_9GAMM|nr:MULTISPECIES: bifunctional DNA-formamidopyrimidine glycosylase/DNA-(apurinic or apyrimidinic site) lyase [unclassified Legionella]MCE0722420.1 bifunctional DNA-formamidopyrimidine glycosylase/DNA-(apurinic or apyrimidinic site) lyase [Legionella sp. 9fVS26]MCE3531574.1 bifunctional DNA-formamidopyrimidine glycosylase/DNA-(apurinic or apyrimidinic site) lyase [Legionella sp. 8cVS16]QLZ67593.1 bifunctional DNA-formamidopyrimidine glycosylase/DNA-(apurinic or apyrimidinic site) lyase [Legionella
MPELPEVETTKEGIKSHLEGQTIKQIIVRNSQLRIAVPDNLDQLCAGKRIIAVSRRAKYILIQLSEGYLLIHLGMSGHLGIVADKSQPEKHDHILLTMANELVLRFCDPRRFGLFLYINENPYQHRLLSHLGPEPLREEFNGHYLFQKAQNKNKPIKSLIMDSEVVVGVGNIYATESLFLAHIHPNTPAKMLSEEACYMLTKQIKEVLKQAILCGGTTLRDFYAFDGKPGYFSISLKVYGRKNKPCLLCQQPIESVVISGRNSFFCPQCQNETSN